MTQPRDFGFGDEEKMVCESARRFLAENAGIERLRKIVAGDHRAAYDGDTPPLAWDEHLWRQIVDLGWTTLAVPAQAGGAGMKMVAVAALAEAAGGVALPSPLLSTLMVTCVLRELDSDPARLALERIASGSAAALVVTNQEGSWEPQETDVKAKRAGEAVLLNGAAYFVQDARKAAFFLVSARAENGMGLYVVEADTPGLRVCPDRIVDLTRDQATIALSDVRVEATQIAATPEEGVAGLTRAIPALLTIIAADQCGAAEWQLQTTAEYARVRTQFDRPIGFFQAVKHPIVDMMIAVDRARSLVYAAACAIDTEIEKAERYARMAKAAAGDMAAYCSGRSVQLHGGIGFTWECDVHIYFKRQLHNQSLFGDSAYQRAKLTELMDSRG